MYPLGEVDGAEVGAPVSMDGIIESGSLDAIRCSGSAAAEGIGGGVTLAEGSGFDAFFDAVVGVTLSGIMNPPLTAGGVVDVDA
jgi:hypothetical protein